MINPGNGKKLLISQRKIKFFYILQKTEFLNIEKQFKKIGEAYEVLSNPEIRKIYDIQANSTHSYNGKVFAGAKVLKILNKYENFFSYSLL